MRQRLLAVIAVLATITCCAQDFSNKGKDFWVGYGYHARMNPAQGNSQNMVLYFTSDVNANVKVEIPLLGYSASYSVKANQVTETAPMPKSGAQDARLMTEGISDAGIHITSDAPIVAYAHIYDGSVSGASLLFPTNTLGRDYYTLGFTQTSNEDKSNAYAFAVATEDNTTIEITPSQTTLGHQANVPFTVSLSKGQIFNLMGALTGGSNFNYTGVDLSGTRIRSISTLTETCKKIAVFCGTGRLSIACNPSGNISSDNIIQQMFPSSAWGKKYITSPTRFMINNYFRVMVTDAATVVKLNGNVLNNLQNGRYYEFSSSTENIIEADKPILVAQYMTTSNNCGNTVLGTSGDPEMIYLSPVEQTIADITLNSTSKFAIKYHFINVIIPTSKKESFKLDGVSQANNFYPHAKDPAYSWAQLNVTAGSHRLTADTGFNAIAYGMGSYESYGYNAGANVRDFYQNITATNVSTGYKLPITCTGEQFKFNVTVPFLPTAITWDFYNNINLADPSAIVVNNPVPDSSYSFEGRTMYVFRMKKTITAKAVGSVPVRVFLSSPAADGCNGLQEIDYVMEIVEKPRPDFSVSFSGCQKDSAFFQQKVNTYQQQLTSLQWTFNDGFTTTANSFNKNFAANGSYNLNLKIGNDIGCFADTTAIVKAGANPSSKFIVVGSNCTEQNISYKDESSVAEGNIVKWIWNYGNGKGDTLTQNLPRIIQYENAGNYTVSLVTQTETGCKDTVSKTIAVTAKPIADFKLPVLCVNDGKAQFTDASRLADNSNTLLNYSWNFGDGNSNTNNAALQSPSHQYTAAGNYAVQLIVKTNTGCADTATRQLTINGGNVTAAFDILTDNGLCQGSKVRIKNNSSVDFGSIVKTEIIWDDLNESAVIEKDLNYQSGKIYEHDYPVLTNASSKTYTIRIRAFSGTSCVSETVKTVTVYAKPKLTFAPIPDLCLSNEPYQITTASSSGTTGSFVFSGKGVSANGMIDPKQIGAGSSVITYTYSDKGCKDSVQQTVNIIASPKAAWTFSNSVCENTPIQLNDQSTAQVPIVKREWNFGDGTAQTNTNADAFTKLYKAFGSFAVALVVTDSAGCKSEVNTQQISVRPSPIVNFSVPAALCLPNAKADFSDQSTIADNSQALFTYQWNFGEPQSNNNTSVMKNPSHVYAAAGVKTIQLIVTSKDGCSASATKSITGIASQPKASLTLPKAEFCMNETIQLSDNTVGQHYWIAGNNNAAGRTLVHRFSAPGTYNFSHYFIDANGCASDTASASVKVFALPTVNAGEDQMITLGSSVQLHPAISNNVIKHVWFPSTYLSNETDLNVTVAPQKNMVYRLQVTGEGNCVAYDDVEIKLMAKPYIPNVFSPNGDGIHDKWVIDNLPLYESCTVEVFDRYGVLVYSSKGYDQPWDGTYKGKPLPFGTYYYVIDTKQKQGNSKFTGNITILR